MKIIFVLPDMPGGGSERVVALLANDFVSRGFEVSILLFAGNKTAYSLNEHIEVFFAGEASGWNIFLKLKRLLKMRGFYRKNKNCYIFSFCVMGTVYSALAAMGIPHRMLVSERNDPTRITHQRLRNWSYRKAEKLVFQTEDMMRCFPEDIQKKSVVIPNPVDKNIPSPFRGIRNKKIVAVGRLEPQKNHKLLLHAYEKFQKDFSEYSLHLYGIGELERELRQMSDSLHISEQTVFHGFCNNVKEEIIDCAMFVLSSDYEGISNSMIEALAMGIPVISTDCPVGGSRCYIENGVNGLLTPVGDEKALVDAMKKIACSQELSKTLSENAVKIKETYRQEKIAERFLQEAGII